MSVLKVYLLIQHKYALTSLETQLRVSRIFALKDSQLIQDHQTFLCIPLLLSF
jgi:hypothetical protein